MRPTPDDLNLYPLPKLLAEYLQQIDLQAQREACAGKPVPSVITLHEGDYATIDWIVRRSSGHRHSAATVRWNGRPLTPCAAVAA